MTKRQHLQDPVVRGHFFKNNFPAFMAWHSPRDFKEFHKDWMVSLQSRNNTFIEGFRASRKTTIVRRYVIRCIVYMKEPHIIVQSFEDTLTKDRVRNIAKMLFKKSILQDYGTLFPLTTKKEELKKKSLSDFECTNGVKITSKSLGQTLRGANEFDMDNDTSSRPTLLILDDIDVEKSVHNPEIIDKNYNKIKGETISALDPLRRKIVFLGNTIREDGVVPRFRKEYEEAKSWDIFRQPLFVDGVNVRPEVFTNEVVETIKDDGDISFNQNYLLRPYIGGQNIILRSQIHETDKVPLHTKEEPVHYVLGIDPAFSLKTNSDSVGIVVSAHRGEDRYIVHVVELEGQEKDEENIKRVVKNLYNRYNASIVNIETNNGGELIARMLQDARIAVNLIKTSKDKVTRLMERQGLFTRGQVYFLPGTGKLQDQLIVFPSKNAKDDLVDAMLFSFDGFYQFDIEIG